MLLQLTALLTGIRGHLGIASPVEYDVPKCQEGMMGCSLQNGTWSLVMMVGKKARKLGGDWELRVQNILHIYMDYWNYSTKIMSSARRSIMVSYDSVLICTNGSVVSTFWEWIVRQNRQITAAGVVVDVWELLSRIPQQSKKRASIKSISLQWSQSYARISILPHVC